MSLYLPDADVEWLEVQCERLDRSRSWVLQKLIERAAKVIEEMQGPAER